MSVSNSHLVQLANHLTCACNAAGVFVLSDAGIWNLGFTDDDMTLLYKAASDETSVCCAPRFDSFAASRGRGALGSGM